MGTQDAIGREGDGMVGQRSSAHQQVAALLRTASTSLVLDIAFLSRLDGTTQHLEVVESDLALPVEDGHTEVQATSLCQAVLDGLYPAVMPDTTVLPGAMERPAVRDSGLRSFVSVPVVLSDGTVYGTLCAGGFTAAPTLGDAAEVLMRHLASVVALIIEPAVRAELDRVALEARLRPIVDQGGPRIELQPIVDLYTGARVGAEALSRFPAEWGTAPDVWFAHAHGIGLGHRLELLAIERAAGHLAGVDGYIAMNVSPATLLTPGCGDLLSRLPLDRLVLELSEHEPVEDYRALHDVLAPFRAAGMALAIDDVGAGFSSLRHIVNTAPDVIKLDRSIISGVHRDRVLTQLVRALADFAHGCDVRVVAEGIEEVAEADALGELGVDYGQGWHYGRPGPPEALSRGSLPSVAAGIPVPRRSGVRSAA